MVVRQTLLLAMWTREREEPAPSRRPWCLHTLQTCKAQARALVHRIGHVRLAGAADCVAASTSWRCQCTVDIQSQYMMNVKLYEPCRPLEREAGALSLSPPKSRAPLEIARLHITQLLILRVKGGEGGGSLPQVGKRGAARHCAGSQRARAVSPTAECYLASASPAKNTIPGW